jgi:hypothetical protein
MPKRKSPSHLCGFFRSLPANGRTNKPSSTGKSSCLDGLFTGRTSAVFGTLTVMVMFVGPEAAGMVEGENVAVAAAGNPVTVNVSGAPTLGGETASTKLAWR